MIIVSLWVPGVRSLINDCWEKDRGLYYEMELDKLKEVCDPELEAMDAFHVISVRHYKFLKSAQIPMTVLTQKHGNNQ